MALVLLLAFVFPFLAAEWLEVGSGEYGANARTSALPSTVIAFFAFLRLLEVIHSRVDVSAETIVLNKVILGKSASYNRLVLRFRHFVIDLVVLLNLKNALKTRVECNPRARTRTWYVRLPPSRTRLSSASFSSRFRFA